MAISKAMIEITTSSSTNEKARDLFLFIGAQEVSGAIPTAIQKMLAVVRVHQRPRSR